MGKWVHTEYGKRYAEEYATCSAYFLSEHDEDGDRLVPFEVLELIIESMLEID